MTYIVDNAGKTFVISSKMRIGSVVNNTQRESDKKADGVLSSLCVDVRGDEEG